MNYYNIIHVVVGHVCLHRAWYKTRVECNTIAGYTSNERENFRNININFESTLMHHFCSTEDATSQVNFYWKVYMYWCIVVLIQFSNLCKTYRIHSNWILSTKWTRYTSIIRLSLNFNDARIYWSSYRKSFGKKKSKYLINIRNVYRRYKINEM